MTKCTSHRDDGSKSTGYLFNRLQLKHPYPMTAIIVLTEQCNLSCPHCYVPAPNEINELSQNELEEIFVQLADLGVLRLVLTGGEPSLRSDLVDIVKMAVDLRFAVTLKTNGTLLENDTVDKLYHVGLPELNISLYHMDSKQHDSFVRMPGAFEKTIAAATRFQSLGGRVHVGIVVMDWNCSSILDLVAFTENRNWSINVNSRIVTRTDGNRTPLEMQACEESLIELVSNSCFFDTNIADLRSLPPPETPLCAAGQGTMCIMPNGDVWPCLILPRSMGNIRNSRIKEIWDTSSVRTEVVTHKRGDAPKCDGCPYAPVCFRCPAAAILENGDVNMPTETDCRNARVWSAARKNWTIPENTDK